MLEVVARTPEFQSYEKTQCRLDTFSFKTIGLEHFTKELKRDKDDFMP